VGTDRRRLTAGPARFLPAALLAVAAAVAALGGGGAAFAVQTDTWGMSPAPDGQTFQPEIAHLADGSTVRAPILVWNRTGAPLTVHLSVLSVTPENGTFGYSPAIRGLAMGVVLPAGQVTLGPKQEARMLVTIHEPAAVAGTEYAAISGESQPVHEGVLSVQERLAVIVKATAGHPAGLGAPAPARHHPSSTSFAVLVLGSIGAAILLILLVLLDRERRRRDPGSAAETPGAVTSSDQPPGGSGDPAVPALPEAAAV
jgi:hypothetical protein